MTDTPENLSRWPAPPEGRCGLDESLETEVAIFGAGIHGSALSRELTLRGVPCALIDRGAIGGGTSQWSSQLLHGGIRYMLTGDVKQMREGLHERATWARLAPWRCQWQAFWMPHRFLLEGLAHRFGIGLYDHWGSDRPGWPEALRLGGVPRESFRADPRAKETAFRGATAYADLLTWDRDLVRDLAASGAAQRLDFHEVGDFEAQRGNLVKVRLTDRRDGRMRELSFRTAVFALGPWHDQAMRTWFGDTLLKLRLSAGIHLWFDAIPGCERPWALRRPGGRILFVVPRDGRLMVGTTEREVSMAEGGFTEITHSEREELFEALRTYIPGIPWRELPVRAEEVGVRPLVRPAKRRSGTSGLSREALLDPHPRFPNAWMVLGGKLTTARLLMDRLATQITGQSCEASRTTPLKKWDGL